MHNKTMAGCGCGKKRVMDLPPRVPATIQSNAVSITTTFSPPVKDSKPIPQAIPTANMSTCQALVNGLCGSGTDMCTCAHTQIPSLGMSYYRVLVNLIGGIGTITCSQLRAAAQAYIACRGGTSITFNDPTVVGTNAIITLIPETGCSTIPAAAISEANCILSVFNTFCLPS